MGEYQFQPITDRIFEELGPLMLDAFGDLAGPEYFEWKYRQNPAGKAIGNIARAGNGEIAAFYGMIPEVCSLGGESRLVYQSCDTMTHSGHRRRGLFQKLAQRTYAEATEADPRFFAFGFGGATSTPGFIKMGWRIRSELPFLFQPFPLTLLGRRSNRVVELDRPDPTLLQMMARAQPEQGVALQRSEAFLRWRTANPLRRYRYLRTDDSYVAYSVTPGFMFIIDFWEEGRAAGRPVISTLRHESAAGRGKGLLTLGSPRGTFVAQLRRHGFLRNPFKRGPGAGTTPLISFGAEPFGDPSVDWDVTPLDHDSY